MTVANIAAEGNMTCVHLQKLYRHCEEHSVKLSSSDLVHFVCLQCHREEICPGTLMDEYDVRRAAREAASPTRVSRPGQARQ